MDRHFSWFTFHHRTPLHHLADNLRHLPFAQLIELLADQSAKGAMPRGFPSGRCQAHIFGDSTALKGLSISVNALLQCA
jgi:hypothetical protein